MRPPELKVKELAALERVAEKTVRRWIVKGILDVRRTPGGGLRIAQASSNAAARVLDIRGHPRT